MNSFSRLFRKYIKRFYYTGSIRLYHYKSLADKPTLEEFYDFQDWHSSNIEGEVKQILSEESKIVSKISKGYKKALNKWRRSLVARIPTPNGLKYSGLFNAAGD